MVNEMTNIQQKKLDKIKMISNLTLDLRDIQNQLIFNAETEISKSKSLRQLDLMYINLVEAYYRARKLIIRLKKL